MEIRPVRAELLHADGQTDMTKLIIACRTSVKAPKKPKTSNQMLRGKFRD
jgi:hypothetical protein